ncbi:uncharacterized protein MAM_02825 [Metarhizium album ARSEF 1941]|uniref:Uncharacterized protein n=1 Tax=Metarhizium album (strain ARSEF 1941) TaxID=1081103 RepID=A0A0B2X0B7_METAS|nr:uncharacterized protein MAM_02825 [Metarhizium album ARSEF 1941]KHN99127.1 hypothetical protein MAM_02825 [Metarhizium album ARSEF 1941]
MERPSDGEANPQRMTRAEYTRNVRAAMEERRHRAMVNRQHYQPQIHEQIQRLFAEYEAPFYARMRGFGRTQTLGLAESTVLGLAAGIDRSLSDTETKALTEHFLSSVHNMLAWKWVMTGLAGYMTYRGRRTLRFPFFKPVVTGGRFNPATGGPQVRIMWHTARFAAYYGAFWLIGEPIFQGVNFLRQSWAMDKDPRLASLLRGGKKQAGEVLGAVQDSGGQQYGDSWRPDSQQEYSSPPQIDAGYRQPSPSTQTQEQQSWTSFRRPGSDRQGPQGGWDAADEIGDASPVAPPSRSKSEEAQSYSGSAWDRVRQQAQYSPRQSRRDQKSWEAPQGNNSGWGGDDDTSPQYRSSRDDYPYSGIDEEKSSAKSQAQREFDALVERERKGADQERGTWGRT